MELSIMINGRGHTVSRNKLSYEEVVQLAGKQPGILYTVTFFKGRGEKREGTLCPGEAAEIQHGTVFDCMYTGNA